MIFIDTGAFVARYCERDQFHAAAIRQWEVLEHSGRRCVTSNFVLDETITLLARRTTYAFAAERAERLLASNLLVVLRSDAVDELAAVELFRKYADQSVSFTDCVSFVLMRRTRITTAFSFDRHFAFAGFEMEPEGT